MPRRKPTTSSGTRHSALSAILCRFGDSTGEPPQDHGFYETLFTSPDFPGMDAYFQRASFGAMSLEETRHGLDHVARQAR
ncbi:MAG: hypothetical protein IPF82_07985 [Blastocatellia bacterium]|nr:hypothetical protein [Blastocatellia bacterium]